MPRFLAILNVIAWAGFWAFGFLALAGGDYSPAHLTVAALLAAAGFIGGTATWIVLNRGTR